MIKTKALQDAIAFALSIEKIAQVVKSFEEHPDRFAVFSITASVKDYSKSIIRVFLNFQEKPGVQNIKEDIIVEIYGTNLDNFKVLGMVGGEYAP